jgi:radical SAM superfamily enzyme YgiQ (UPF0313 family)
MPRYGLPVIGAVLDQAGYEVKIFVEHIAEPDMNWILSADVLLVSAFTGAANKTRDFLQSIRKIRNVPIVLGGKHGSFLMWNQHCRSNGVHDRFRRYNLLE